MSSAVFNALTEALKVAAAAGFVGASSYDLYKSSKVDKDNGSHTPLLDRLMDAIFTGLHFDAVMIVRAFRFLVWLGAISVGTVVNVTKWLGKQVGLYKERPFKEQ